jgi:hypothetical protein
MSAPVNYEVILADAVKIIADVLADPKLAVTEASERASIWDAALPILLQALIDEADPTDKPAD